MKIKIIIAICLFCMCFCTAVAFKLSGDNVIMEQRIYDLERQVKELQELAKYGILDGCDRNYASKR